MSDDIRGVYPGLYNFVRSNSSYVCDLLLTELDINFINQNRVSYFVCTVSDNSFLFTMFSFGSSLSSNCIMLTRNDELLVMNHISNIIVKDTLVSIFRRWSRDKKISKVLNEF